MSKLTALKQIDKDAFFKMFSAEDRKRLASDSGLRRAEAFVVFENQDTTSPEFGRRTVVPVGPHHNYKSVVELDGAWIGDDSTRRNAVAFCINS